MRILLIEDEIKLANAIAGALQLQKYAVDKAFTGKDGYDFAIGENFDLIILDLMLPEIDGIEVCKRIRKEGIHTPILMLTAKGEINDKVTGLDVGADDYMIKPFAFEELFARVRALIRRPKGSIDTTLKVKDLSLDPISFKVKRGEKSIKLSTKEFCLLEYLMRHKNSIVSKDQIIAHIWNYEADVLPNVVEVHVKHLRDKIECKTSPSLIKTIRGFGYIIGDE
jgi:DNA-binding response OmpR family regulator